MMDVLERYIEIAISIFIYVTCSVLTLSVLIAAREPIVVQGSDKTFIESTGVQELYEEEVYGYDILLMLLNVDEMTPYPKSIKINDTPVVKIDNSFIAYKMRNVGVIYSAVGEYKLSTMLHYKIEKEEYVYKGTGAPYIHYTLKEVI